ncbi:MAG: aminotransferase class I/II-fold pyridoxal phosphate-dependent enzyme [Clostridiaceae bacterium]|nr:aminotransferase class I/II-fold pyridoxal phosphate-dependent enzyme [Clostridiaceae bacterium]
MDYLHGGDIYSVGVSNIVDFSSNINPFGVPESFNANINEALLLLTKYPDPHYRELKQGLSLYLKKYYEVNFLREDLLLGNGAVEVIDIIISFFKNVLIPVPSFSEYESSARKNGAKVVYSSLKDDMSYDYEDIYKKIQFSDVLVIGNPNNPSGNVINKDKFRKILEFCEKNNKIIIIDEAFIEFTGNIEESFIKDTEKYNCLVIIRALTKFFALPGIRFGYAVSKNIKFLEELRGIQLPWNINCFAEVAVKYVLKDEGYINKSLIWIEEEKNYFPQQLRKINFIEKVFESNCNFLLCKLNGINGQQLFNYSLSKGLLIRRGNNFIGLDDSYIRLAIKDRILNEEVIRIFETYYR